MIRYVLVILAPLLWLGLGGCTALGGAAGALGVQALTIGGQGAVRAIEQDINAAIRWTARHEAAVAVFQAACLAHAQRLAVGDDWPAADAAFQNCLDTSMDNIPTLLMERVALRYERSFGEKAVELPIEEEGAAEEPTESTEEEGAEPLIE